MPEQPTRIHESCPQGHRYLGVTSKGFAWCKKCQLWSPATTEAEAALEGMRAKGTVPAGMDTDRNAS